MFAELPTSPKKTFNGYFSTVIFLLLKEGKIKVYYKNFLCLYILLPDLWICAAFPELPWSLYR